MMPVQGSYMEFCYIVCILAFGQQFLPFDSNAGAEHLPGPAGEECIASSGSRGLPVW